MSHTQLLFTCSSAVVSCLPSPTSDSQCLTVRSTLPAQIQQSVAACFRPAAASRRASWSHSSPHSSPEEKDARIASVSFHSSSGRDFIRPARSQRSMQLQPQLSLPGLAGPGCSCKQYAGQIRDIWPSRTCEKQLIAPASAACIQLSSTKAGCVQSCLHMPQPEICHHPKQTLAATHAKQQRQETNFGCANASPSTGAQSQASTCSSKHACMRSQFKSWAQHQACQTSAQRPRSSCKGGAPSA